MKIESFINNMVHDLAEHARLRCVPSQQVLKEIYEIQTAIITGFAASDFSYLDDLTDEYKACLTHLCKFGVLPTHVCGVSIFHLREFRDAKLEHILLNCLSWPSKLTFAGESCGTADYSGFLSRSRECENHVDFSRILPFPEYFRKWLRTFIQAPDYSGRPKHGPGATYEKLRSWDKWLAINPDIHIRPIMRMSSVPKDRQKRRLIGIEPCALQFLQQGAASEIRHTTYFRRWVDIVDQMEHINVAARSQNLATIDMSDASDRISCSLVEHVLPSWYTYLATISSRYAQVPTSTRKKELVTIGMMANMGCGFCFELETLIFHIVATWVVTNELSLTPSAAASRVRVYGDDIILPSSCLPAFSALCAKIGWVVNEKKTCLTDQFLETCGYYIRPASNGQAAVVTRRFLPTLQTADQSGSIKQLAFQSGAQCLALAVNSERSGLHRLARSLCVEFWNKSGCAIRYNWELCRLELRYTALKELTRPLNVTEEIRYRAYWVSGLADQRLEATGTTILKESWFPIDEVEQYLLESSVPQFWHLSLTLDERLESTSRKGKFLNFSLSR